MTWVSFNNLSEDKIRHFARPIRNWLLKGKMKNDGKPDFKARSSKASRLKRKIKDRGIKRDASSPILSRLFISKRGSVQYTIERSWNEDYLTLLEVLGNEKTKS